MDYVEFLLHGCGKQEETKAFHRSKQKPERRLPTQRTACLLQDDAAAAAATLEATSRAATAGGRGRGETSSELVMTARGATMAAALPSRENEDEENEALRREIAAEWRKERKRELLLLLRKANRSGQAFDASLQKSVNELAALKEHPHLFPPRELLQQLVREHQQQQKQDCSSVRHHRRVSDEHISLSARHHAAAEESSGCAAAREREENCFLDSHSSSGPTKKKSSSSSSREEKQQELTAGECLQLQLQERRQQLLRMQAQQEREKAIAAAEAAVERVSKKKKSFTFFMPVAGRVGGVFCTPSPAASSYSSLKHSNTRSRSSSIYQSSTANSSKYTYSSDTPHLQVTDSPGLLQQQRIHSSSSSRRATADAHEERVGSSSSSSNFTNTSSINPSRTMYGRYIIRSRHVKTISHNKVDNSSSSNDNSSSSSNAVTLLKGVNGIPRPAKRWVGRKLVVERRTGRSTVVYDPFNKAKDPAEAAAAETVADTTASQVVIDDDDDEEKPPSAVVENRTKIQAVAPARPTKIEAAARRAAAAAGTAAVAQTAAVAGTATVAGTAAVAGTVAGGTVEGGTAAGAGAAIAGVRAGVEAAASIGAGRLRGRGTERRCLRRAGRTAEIADAAAASAAAAAPASAALPCISRPSDGVGDGCPGEAAGSRFSTGAAAAGEATTTAYFAGTETSTARTERTAAAARTLVRSAGARSEEEATAYTCLNRPLTVAPLGSNSTQSAAVEAAASTVNLATNEAFRIEEENEEGAAAVAAAELIFPQESGGEERAVTESSCFAAAPDMHPSSRSFSSHVQHHQSQQPSSMASLQQELPASDAGGQQQQQEEQDQQQELVQQREREQVIFSFLEAHQKQQQGEDKQQHREHDAQVVVSPSQEQQVVARSSDSQRPSSSTPFGQQQQQQQPKLAPAAAQVIPPTVVSPCLLLHQQQMASADKVVLEPADAPAAAPASLLICTPVALHVGTAGCAAAVLPLVPAANVTSVAADVTVRVCDSVAVASQTPQPPTGGDNVVLEQNVFPSPCSSVLAPVQAIAETTAAAADKTNQAQAAVAVGVMRLPPLLCPPSGLDVCLSSSQEEVAGDDPSMVGDGTGRYCSIYTNERRAEAIDTISTAASAAATAPSFAASVSASLSSTPVGAHVENSSRTQQEPGLTEKDVVTTASTTTIGSGWGGAAAAVTCVPAEEDSTVSPGVSCAADTPAAADSVDDPSSAALAVANLAAFFKIASPRNGDRSEPAATTTHPPAASTTSVHCLSAPVTTTAVSPAAALASVSRAVPRGASATPLPPPPATAAAAPRPAAASAAAAAVRRPAAASAAAAAVRRPAAASAAAAAVPQPTAASAAAADVSRPAAASAAAADVSRPAAASAVVFPQPPAASAASGLPRPAAACLPSAAVAAATCAPLPSVATAIAAGKTISVGNNAEAWLTSAAARRATVCSSETRPNHPLVYSARAATRRMREEEEAATESRKRRKKGLVEDSTHGKNSSRDKTAPVKTTRDSSSSKGAFTNSLPVQERGRLLQAQQRAKQHMRQQQEMLQQQQQRRQQQEQQYEAKQQQQSRFPASAASSGKQRFSPAAKTDVAHDHFPIKSEIVSCHAGVQQLEHQQLRKQQQREQQEQLAQTRQHQQQAQRHEQHREQQQVQMEKMKTSVCAASLTQRKTTFTADTSVLSTTSTATGGLRPLSVANETLNSSLHAKYDIASRETTRLSSRFCGEVGTSDALTRSRTSQQQSNNCNRSSSSSKRLSSTTVARDAVSVTRDTVVEGKKREKSDLHKVERTPHSDKVETISPLRRTHTHSSSSTNNSSKCHDRISNSEPESINGTRNNSSSSSSRRDASHKTEGKTECNSKAEPRRLSNDKSRFTTAGSSSSSRSSSNSSSSNHATKSSICVKGRETLGQMVSAQAQSGGKANKPRKRENETGHVRVISGVPQPPLRHSVLLNGGIFVTGARANSPRLTSVTQRRFFIPGAYADCASPTEGCPAQRKSSEEEPLYPRSNIREAACTAGPCVSAERVPSSGRSVSQNLTSGLPKLAASLPIKRNGAAGGKLSYAVTTGSATAIHNGVVSTRCSGIAVAGPAIRQAGVPHSSNVQQQQQHRLSSLGGRTKDGTIVCSGSSRIKLCTLFAEKKVHSKGIIPRAAFRDGRVAAAPQAAGKRKAETASVVSEDDGSLDEEEWSESDYDFIDDETEQQNEVNERKNWQKEIRSLTGYDPRNYRDLDAEECEGTKVGQREDDEELHLQQQKIERRNRHKKARKTGRADM